VSQAYWILVTFLSHWKKHPMQLVTLLVGLAAATALWSGVQAINQQAKSSYDRAARMLGVGSAATVVARDGQPFSQQLFVDLRRGGWRVSPILEGRVEVNGRSVKMLGIEPLTFPRTAGPETLVRPSELRAFLTPPSRTLVAPETAAELGLREGAASLMSSGVSLPPVKMQDDLVPGVLVVDIGYAQRLLNLPGQVTRLLIDGNDTTKSPSLASIAGNQLALAAPESESDLARLTDSFHLNLSAFGLLSFLVGLFIVHSAIGLAFEQRLPMIRTMRACGVSARSMVVIGIIELLSLAMIAGFVGLVLGYFIAAFMLPDVAASLRGLYGATVEGRLTLRSEWWIAGFAMSAAGALVASAGSLVKIHRLPLLAAAQPNALLHAQYKSLRWHAALAVVALLIAVAFWFWGDNLLAGFGVLAGLLLGATLSLPIALSVVLHFAERTTRAPLMNWVWADSRQQLSGLSLALMALLLALATNVGVTTMVKGFSQTFSNWLDGRLSAEIYLTATNAEQAAEIVSWLKQRPEVEAILPTARVEMNLEGWPVELLGLADHATYRDHWPLLNAEDEVWDRMRSGRAALVSEQLSRHLGVGLRDQIRVPTRSGDLSLDVVGIYADYGNPKGQIALSIDALLAQFPTVERTRYGLRLAPSHIPLLMDALQKKFGLGPRNLTDQATLKTEAHRVFDRTFAVTASLNTLTFGVAAIAILTSLLTLSNARLPQLAPLWAIGITRRQLAGIELLKTMGMALLTGLFALPCGLLVAWCLVELVNVRAFGWRLPFHVFPVDMLKLLAAAVLASMLATLWPVFKLMRTSPARLIRIFADER
jgi:putative ABC transport system permease protein